MKRVFVIGAIVLASAELGAFGCNAILGNEPGTVAFDASASSACPPDQKSCGACVPVNDPKLGCGGVCSACPTPKNAQSACALENSEQVCAMGACNAQFGDCNSDPSDGCETHTTVKANCGSCGADCNGLFCERQGDGYICSATCDSPNITCGGDAGECVDPSTDISNCGGCGIDCAVANGTGTCNNGNCEISCAANYFQCSNQCVAPSDQQCGASCTPCSPSFHCDVNPTDPTYGTCLANTCTNSLDCSGGTPICCGGSCVAEGTLSCGPACDGCNGSGAVCTLNHMCGCTNSNDTTCSIGSNHWCCGMGTTCDTTTVGTCDAICGPPYNCNIPTGGCGCLNAGCFAADFSKAPNCGSCGQNCNVFEQCSPSLLPDGGPTYSCQVIDAGGPDGGSDAGKDSGSDGGPNGDGG